MGQIEVDISLSSTVLRVPTYLLNIIMLKSLCVELNALISGTAGSN